MMDSVLHGVRRHSVNTIPLAGEHNDMDALSEHSSESLDDGLISESATGKDQLPVEV